MSVYQKKLYFCKTILRGRAVVARRAHNPEVAGSSPAPATQSEGVICQQITPFFIFVQSVPLFHFFDYLCKI